MQCRLYEQLARTDHPDRPMPSGPLLTADGTGTHGGQLDRCYEGPRNHGRACLSAGSGLLVAIAEHRVLEPRPKPSVG